MRIVSALLGAVFLLGPAVASAQKQDEPKGPVVFVDMEAMEVTGQVRGPAVLRTDARRRAEFEWLLRIRHDVLPALQASAHDPSLR